MDKSSKFPLISEKTLSTELLKLGINHFEAAISYVKKLPYGRNTNKTDLNLVLKEQKGTCSTKHAFLAEVAKQNNISNIKLYLGIYKMNETNTKGVGAILSKWSLKYIPEAHCYLKINNKITDVTSTTVSNTSFIDSILNEEEISPYQIDAYKIDRHQLFLKQWLIDEAIPYNFHTIWNIREACIQSLSQ